MYRIVIATKTPFLRLVTYNLSLIRQSLHYNFAWGNQRAPFTKSTSMPHQPHDNNQHKIPLQDEIRNVLVSRGIEFQQKNQHFQLKYCPICPKPHNNDHTNMYTFGIELINGLYNCFRCGQKGHWKQLYHQITGDKTISLNKTFNHTFGTNFQRLPQYSEAQYYPHTENLFERKYSNVKQYILSRGLSQETMRQYNIGAGYEKFMTNQGECQVECVYFPGYKVLQGWGQKDHCEIKANPNFHYLNNHTQICKVKVRGIGKEGKKYMKQNPSGSYGLFGLNLVRPEDEEIVITEGEWDAMAVYQATGKPAISLPNGATSLSDELLPWLHRFKRIYLWMDNDLAGSNNTTRLVEKLGRSRTYVIKHSEEGLKDANDFLLKGLIERIRQLIEGSRLEEEWKNPGFVWFRNYNDKVHDRVKNIKKYLGVSVGDGWLPFFHKIVKGIRKGELTIVSGPTGSGKTTFLSQLSLDFCKQDYHVLWGSFQVRNQILMTSMLYQFSKVRLDKQIQKFNHYAEQFQKLPLSFMNYHGPTNSNLVIQDIKKAINEHKCRMVIIDTLQFMISSEEHGFKRFIDIDNFLKDLRILSIESNIHIIIVIHPRKTDQKDDIGIHSIYGTSQATQQADNVWIIQNRQGYKLLDIKKNRYDGQLGRIPLGFNRHTKSFFQLTKAQFTDLAQEKRKMKQIIQDREEEAAMDGQGPLVPIEEDIRDQDMERQRQSGSRFYRGNG